MMRRVIGHQQQLAEVGLSGAVGNRREEINRQDRAPSVAVPRDPRERRESPAVHALPFRGAGADGQ